MIVEVRGLPLTHRIVAPKQNNLDGQHVMGDTL